MVTSGKVGSTPAPLTPHWFHVGTDGATHAPGGCEKVYYSHSEAFRGGQGQPQPGPFSSREGGDAWLWFSLGWGVGRGVHGQRLAWFAGSQPHQGSRAWLSSQLARPWGGRGLGGPESCQWSNTQNRHFFNYKEYLKEDGDGVV